MTKLEQVYRLIEKYYWVLFVVLIVSPNFLEPTWFWRWMGILAITTVFIAIFLWAYYAWWILKRDPLSLTTTSKEQYRNLNSSQKKWHMGISYLTVLIGGPFVFYMASFPLIDTARSLFTEDYTQTAVVTIENSSTFAGTWFVGQTLIIDDKSISDGSLLLMFSLEHALRGERYEIRYLPYSGLILELRKES